MGRRKLPEERPTSGDLKVIEEKDYEIVLDWGRENVDVYLYIRNHSDFPEIVPEVTEECKIHSGGRASTISDLPAKYQHQFKDMVRVVLDKYYLSGSDEGECGICYGGDHETIVFETTLYE